MNRKFFALAEHHAEEAEQEIKAGHLGQSPHAALAQVYATLALAAATAYPAVRDYLGESDDAREWARVTAE